MFCTIFQFFHVSSLWILFILLKFIENITEKGKGDVGGGGGGAGVGGRGPPTRPLDQAVMNIFPYQFSFLHFLAKSSHKLLQSNQRMELGQICWKEKKK